MLHASGVDETLFVQILYAYNTRNPLELISDEAYDACLAKMAGATQETTQSATELQQRYGAKLFVRQRDDGQRVLVAGTKKRNAELIPLRRVHATLQTFVETKHLNALQLKQTVKAKVVGIPEEIVQEYCDMAVSSLNAEDTHTGKEDDFRKCTGCSQIKSVRSFAKSHDKPTGRRSVCKACESKSGEMVDGEMEMDPLKRKKKKEPYMVLTGTAICAACGDRKSVYEFDKARQKPFTLKCRTCTDADAPLMSKQCCSCQKDLPLDRYYRDSYTKAGFRPRCMECMKSKKGGLQKFDDPVEMEDVTLDRTPPELVVTRKKRTQRKPRRKTQNVEKADDPTPGPAKMKKRRGKRGAKRQPRGSGVALEPKTAKVGALSALTVKAVDEKQSGDGAVADPNAVPTSNNEAPTANTTVTNKQGHLTKYCIDCQRFKKKGAFGQDPSQPTGLRSRCRQCHKRFRDATSGSEEKPTEIVRKKIPRKPVRKRRPAVEKTCARCDLVKPLTEFYKDKSKEDGLAAICKKCAREAKFKSEKKAAKRKNRTFDKVRTGHVQEIDDADMQVLLNYVDALFPESSECSAGRGDEDVSEEEISVAQHRVCMGCKVDKNWIEFDTNPLLPDGLCPLCKDCRRGNGMKGRRLAARPLKRCCPRCGISKTAVHFAKSIFFPNRISRICQQCRNQPIVISCEPSTSRKRRRFEMDHREALDLMDFEMDALRVKDPGGPEDLWKRHLSDSETEQRRAAKPRLYKRDGMMHTELKSDAPNSVTITHHIPAEGTLVHAGGAPAEVEVEEGAWEEASPKKAKLTHVTEKQCKRCGELKSRDSYYVNDCEPSHLSANCINCCEEMA